MEKHPQAEHLKIPLSGGSNECIFPIPITLQKSTQRAKNISNFFILFSHFEAFTKSTFYVHPSSLNLPSHTLPSCYLSYPQILTDHVPRVLLSNSICSTFWWKLQKNLWYLVNVNVIKAFVAKHSVFHFIHPSPCFFYFPFLFILI